MSTDLPPAIVRSSFKARGHRLAYTEFGEGKRWVLLMPGLLIPALMQEHLATALAASGAHVLTLDPLGHGRSDRPDSMAEYSIESFASDAIALLDHLDVDEAVIGGTSLGANVTLEIAHAAPRRVRGMIIEMPVLENALVASVIAFGPLLVGLHFGERVITARRSRAAQRSHAARSSPSGATSRWTWSVRTPVRARRCSRVCSSATSPRTARSGAS